jgi:proteasome accessory factor B
MMRASGKIKRYFRIIDIIQESPHPTSKKVLDSLYNDGFDISERTLQRSLKDLRNEFFINVQFNRSRGAYELMESEEEYVQQLLKFFKLSYQAETLSSSLGQSKKLSEHVSYDYNELIKGTEYIAPILQAIQKKTLLKINHRSFYTNKTKEHIIEPYLLKEFKGRWYLLGRINESEKGEGFLSFGFDRIIKLEGLKDRFKPHIKNPKKFYKDIIGLSGWDRGIETVKIEFPFLQGQYVKSLPIHESQAILEDTKDKVVISIKVKPNFEFYQILWGYGQYAKVLEPKLVVDNMVWELEETLKLYK